MADTYIFNLIDTPAKPYTKELDLYLSTGYQGDLSILAKTFYDLYEDDYDFIFFLRVAPKANNWKARLYDVNKNTCLGLGIGSPPDLSWDARSSFGSNGRLAAAVAVPLVMEPSDPPHIHRALIRHWGVKLAGLTRFPLITDYGWLFNSANGVAGGFDKATLRDLNNNPILDPLSIKPDVKFKVAKFDTETSPVSRPFAPIELWMMGLAPKEEVGDLYYMKQPLLSFYSNDPSAYVFQCGGFGRLTVDEIITNNFGGPPKAASSNFRSAWVLVSEQPAAPEVLAKAELYAKLCGGIQADAPPPGQARWLSFAEATSGHATMDVRLGGLSPHLPITTHPNNRMVTVTLPQSEFDGWCTGGYNTDYQKSSKIARQLYARFKDDFDFIAFVLDLDTKPDGVPFGQHSPVANSIQGIGKSPRDDSSTFGSSGRLKGYFTLWTRTAMENGPFLHELCHQWANSAIPTAGFSADDTGAVKTIAYGKDAGGHWGYSGCGGQLGGFDQASLKSGVDNEPNKYQASVGGYTSFGQNANWGNCVPYSNFELYLMGLIPASELQPFDVFTGLTYDPQGAANGKFYATQKTTYDQKSIVELLGPRVPECKDAQKEFRVLIAVLTPAPALKPEDASVIDAMLVRQSTAGDDGRYTFNFYEATGGRGRMSFDLSKSKR
mgnify:CR=1 FL=1